MNLLVCICVFIIEVDFNIREGGVYMNFETLLAQHKRVIERYVYFRISNKEDAEDILQETYLSAFQKYDNLESESYSKSWLIKIAKNKCNDYYRKNKINTVDNTDLDMLVGKSGIGEHFEILEIINSLNNKDKEILNMYYFVGYSQEEISKLLDIPVGTVKSRLHTARNHFKSKYIYTPSEKQKGDISMTLPEIMPGYKITKIDKEPFDVKCEELMGWLIVPKLNEKIEWALYNQPSGKQTERVVIKVVGRASVHDVEGVEIVANEYNPMENNRLDSNEFAQRKFVAQLTDTHCRFLAESHKQNGITRYYTFLDENEFTKNWGYGVDNCGKETNLSVKGIIKRDNNSVFSKANVMDVVGRYIVDINGKQYDSICLMDIETYDEGVVTEQYIDKNGKTILWRRFNADDWKCEKYNQLWSDKLPDNETIIVNDKIYVHWYDCISNYIK